MSRTSGPPPSFLGTGWSFPPEFGPGGAELAVVSDVDDIHQSLTILLATASGERPMQEPFGCNLDAELFAEIDHALVNRITSMITDAILRYETRIDLLDVDVSTEASTAGVLRVALDYRVLETNSRYNMVFPFYLNEASTPGL